MNSILSNLELVDKIHGYLLNKIKVTDHASSIGIKNIVKIKNIIQLRDSLSRIFS